VETKKLDRKIKIRYIKKLFNGLKKQKKFHFIENNKRRTTS